MVKVKEQEKEKPKQVPMDQALLEMVNNVNALINGFNNFNLHQFEPHKQEALKKLIEAKGWLTQAMFDYKHSQKSAPGQGGKEKGNEVPEVPEKGG